MNKNQKFALIKLILALILPVLLLSACLGTAGTDTSSPGATGTPAAPDWGHQTKTSNCAAQGALPDPACTPGDIFSNVTKADVCKPGYASSVRDVPQSVKNKVYAEYGIASHQPGEYEVDHFVSLELGGSNDISNLWPEPAKPTPGFHEKDKVENYLHDQVCSGAMTLPEAQVKIATNWLEVYNNLPKK
jgi:hypothetical protein